MTYSTVDSLVTVPYPTKEFCCRNLKLSSPVGPAVPVVHDGERRLVTGVEWESDQGNTGYVFLSGMAEKVPWTDCSLDLSHNMGFPWACQYARQVLNIDGRTVNRWLSVWSKGHRSVPHNHRPGHQSSDREIRELGRVACIARSRRLYAREWAHFYWLLRIWIETHPWIYD